MTHLTNGLVEYDIDGFLSQHDIVYQSPPEEGYEGLPIGNGDLGAMCWTPNDRLRFQINKCDTWDDKPLGMLKAWGKEEEEEATCLRHVGWLDINPGFPACDWMVLDAFEGRLELAKASLSWLARGPMGEVHCNAFVAKEPSVLAIHYRDELSESGIRRISLARWGTRVFAHWYRWIRRHRLLGPTGTQSGVAGNELWIVQPTKSLEFAMACRLDGPNVSAKRINSNCCELEVEAAQKCEFFLYLTACTSEEAEDPLARCRERLDHAGLDGFEKISGRHQSWWSGFWQASFVRLPEDYLENLWYLNLYQTASTSQGRYPPPFINSLWSWNRDVRSWNHYYHWNQQQYTWFLHSAGHPELFLPYARWARESLSGAMNAAEASRGKQGAFYSDVANRKGDQDHSTDEWSGTEHNLTAGPQIAAMLWQHFQFTMDRDYLEQVAYPVMREVVRFYLDVLELGDDGLFHIPLSCPYEGNGMVRDATTDLACIRQLFPSFVTAAQLLGEDSALAQQAGDAIARLAEFVRMQIPKYAKVTGKGQAGDEIMSAGVNLEDGEPYHVWLPDPPGKTRVMFSSAIQIVPVFPAGLVSVDDRGTEFYDLMVRTLRAFSFHDALGIFGQLISAARLGCADIIEGELRQWVERYQVFPQGLFSYYDRERQTSDEPHATRPYDRSASFRVKVLDPTDGHETEEETNNLRWPFTHCGLEASSILHTTVNEMLLQSCGKRIHVFPATPDEWDCAFRLHARGGFIVTSEKKDGGIRFVAVESRLGLPCAIANPWKDEATWSLMEIDDLKNSSNGGLKFIKEGSGDIDMETVAGHCYVIAPVDAPIINGSAICLTGTMNRKPKQMGRAMLGRARLG